MSQDPRLTTAAAATYSLNRRLLVSVSVALALLMGLSALVLDSLFRDLAQRSLKELLDTELVALIAAAETDATGRVTGAVAVADSRLATPGSGLYAEIREAGGPVLWRSPSVAGTFLSFEDLPPAADGMPPVLRLASGERVAVAVRDIQWEANRGGAQALQFYVAGSLTSYESQLQRFRTQLTGGVVALSALLLATIALLLRWLTTPLRRLEQEIQDVEAGRREALGAGYPREIAGVGAGLNALLASERRRVERYRETLGNLAHSLKTPLAVIRSSVGVGAGRPEAERQIAEQVDRMNAIVESQLRRAVQASGAALRRESLELAPLVDELRATLLKVHGRKDFALESQVPGGLSVAAERTDLMEILGNVLDNACKWCRERVRVTARAEGDRVRLVVEDDGPGFPESMRENGPQRGLRADERTPGHGIGLAMVRDSMQAYGGELRLAASEWGGARVELIFAGRAP